MSTDGSGSAATLGVQRIVAGSETSDVTGTLKSLTSNAFFASAAFSKVRLTRWPPRPIRMSLTPGYALAIASLIFKRKLI